MKPSGTTVDLSKDSAYRGVDERSIRGRCYKYKKYLAFKQYKKIIERYATQCKKEKLAIAELGSGPGYLLGFLSEWFQDADIIGVEFDPRLVAEARERAKNVTVICANVEEKCLDNSRFDVVISLHVIEHLYRPLEMILRAQEALRPGGVLVIATPNLTGLGARTQKQNWTGYREDHVSLKGKGEWDRLIADTGLECVQSHTTFLSGIPLFNRMPLGLLNWGLLFLFGSWPWRHGEAYIAIWRKR